MSRVIKNTAQNVGAIRINSPGGDVWDGRAIYNMLASHPATKRVEIDGLAASAASVIAMAADEIRMAENGFLLVDANEENP